MLSQGKAFQTCQWSDGKTSLSTNCILNIYYKCSRKNIQHPSNKIQYHNGQFIIKKQTNVYARKEKKSTRISLRENTKGTKPSQVQKTQLTPHPLLVLWHTTLLESSSNINPFPHPSPGHKIPPFWRTNSSVAKFL